MSGRFAIVTKLQTSWARVGDGSCQIEGLSRKSSRVSDGERSARSTFTTIDLTLEMATTQLWADRYAK